MGNSILDSRDLQERIEELEAKEEENNLTESEKEELKALLELKNECEDYGWDYGIAFIADYEFEDYCRELAEDCYSIDPTNPLSNHIDWKSWADAVEMDYTQTEYNGTTYLYREA